MSKFSRIFELGDSDDDITAQYGPFNHSTVVLYGGAEVGTVKLGSLNAGAPHGSSPSGGSSPVTGGSSGLIINVSYDASVSSAPTGFKEAVAQVVQYFQANFSDPITINISVGYGEVGGSSLGGALGASLTYLSSFSYSTIKSYLTADAKTAVDTSAVASLASDPTGGHYWVSTAEGKALGLIGASTSTDGYVGFSSSAGIFDYNNSDGVGAGQYDFYGVVAHEFSEVMGRILLVGGTIGSYSNSYDLFDLFHYSASGVHDFSGSTPGYFSVDGGATSINTFNTIRGGDAGDWAGATIDAYNAYGTPGVVEPISSGDLTAMDAIGWDAVSGSSPPLLADLTASNLVLHVSGATTIDYQVHNVGTDTATPSTAGFYLSTDSTITTSDTYIGSAATASLEGGATDTESGVPLTLPDNLTPGTYYLGVLADSGTVITEASEANNASNTIPLILGNNSGNTLTGTSGNDTIFGFDGSDRLTGGKGADVLTGGADADTFAYAATTDSSPSAPDVMSDFVHGVDHLDLSAIDADTSHRAKGNQVFGFAGSSSGVVAHSVTWYESGGNTIVQADVDGNSTADFVLVLTGINHGLTASDFVL